MASDPHPCRLLRGRPHLLAFFGTQQGWLRADEPRYLLVNLAGALIILASLAAEWNLPSAIIEGFGALISLYGLARVARRRAGRGAGR